jgi:hypothetical protein
MCGSTVGARRGIHRECCVIDLHEILSDLLRDDLARGTTTKSANAGRDREGPVERGRNRTTGNDEGHGTNGRAAGIDRVESFSVALPGPQKADSEHRTHDGEHRTRTG